MSNTLDKLIRMANQIACNFAARGEQVAVKDTAEHIRKFWDPGMRQSIQDYLSTDGAGLSPIASEALRELAGESK